MPEDIIIKGLWEDEVLEYRGFHAETSYDEHDCLFVGRVSGIQDYLFFHGTTAEELETAFHDCIDSYLEFLSETPGGKFA